MDFWGLGGLVDEIGMVLFSEEMVIVECLVCVGGDASAGDSNLW